MAKKLSNNRYECSYCGNNFETVLKADSCEKSHELVYVPLKKSELMKLIQFLYTREEKLLSSNLVETLTKYARIKTETTEDLSHLQE